MMAASSPQGVSINFRVRYYETDAMGIVHHSNYLRWFELGRTEYLRQAGLTYRSLEDRGIASPVTAVRCTYKKPARYDDPIELTSTVKAYDGIRLTMAYQVSCQGSLICHGETDHAFIADGRVLAPRRSLPDVDLLLTDCLARDQGPAGKRAE